MKVGQECWINKLKKGEACFSLVNDFIEEGERTNNNEQGDKFEGVFARLEKTNPKIDEMSKRLGKDLEIIEDGDYVLLRRKSCRSKQVFCLYGLYIEDAILIKETDLGEGKVLNKYILIPSKKMFGDFLNGNNTTSISTWGVSFSLGHLQRRFEEKLEEKGIGCQLVKVKYDFADNDEFFIEPTDDYQELGYKTKRLSYQKEARFILSKELKGNILNFIPLSDGEPHELKNGIYFKCDVEGHIREARLLKDIFSKWENECKKRFAELKSNEEELNRIFIDIYGLQDELTPEVEDKDVTVRLADKTRDVKSLLSYAVGCMFGRYSLDFDGLAYAGGEFSEQWVMIDDEYYKREVVEYYVSQELLKVYIMMAEAEETANGNILDDIGEIVFTFGTNNDGSSVNPFQYRRGTSKKLYEGICKLSVDCTGLEGGTGDAAYDLCSPEILDAISSGDCSELVSRGWNDADQLDWEAIRSKLVGSGQSDTNHYTLNTNHYCPDKDNIIPICDDEYFTDDIANRFVDFVRFVYGKGTLEENLKFIADALGGKGTPRQVIRDYFLNDFYNDHCKIYQKRPIYWLFDSGKKNGFKCLIYMHRYKPDTIARIRTDYVHEQQARYRTAIAGLENQIANAGTGERVKLNKQLKKLQDQANELHGYEEKIHHLADQFISIDLDDGVKHNYEIFKDVLAKIK